MIPPMSSGRTLQRRGTRLGMTALAASLLIAGCTSPLDDDDSSAGDDALPTATAIVPAMTVLTPTTVDPSSLPADASGTPESIDVPEVYVVAEGDTLYNIAARFRLEIADLVEANDLADPNDIHEGQELVIPKP